MAKTLVAYFSATQTTAKVAQRLAEGIKADLYEIEPTRPYSSQDLDWTNKQSRSSIEMNDPSARPAIVKKELPIQSYDVVFLGFPIWWYREPSIIDTFIEAYDFSNKVIVPFATSGGSGLGSTSSRLQKLVPQAKVVEGKRFSASISKEDLIHFASKWI